MEKVLDTALRSAAGRISLTCGGGALTVSTGTDGTYRVPLALFESGFDQWVEQTHLFPEDQEPQTLRSAAAARAGRWHQVRVADETLLTAAVDLMLGSTRPEHRCAAG